MSTRSLTHGGHGAFAGELLPFASVGNHRLSRPSIPDRTNTLPAAQIQDHKDNECTLMWLFSPHVASLFDAGSATLKGGKVLHVRVEWREALILKMWLVSEC